MNLVELEFAGERVASGTKAIVPLPVTTGLNGAEVEVIVHVVHGASDGPILVLLSTLHGGEWFSIRAMRDLVNELDPKSLAGTVLCVPVANPPALGLQTRNMPDESDSPDLNRVFPGTHTWMTDQIAAVLTGKVLSRASAVLDFHVGPWGSAFQDILIGSDYSDRSVSDRAEQLALAFGSPIVRRAAIVGGFPGPASTIGYSGGVLGVPSMGVNLGGAGFDSSLERQWTRATVDGVRSVMVELGMIEELRIERPSRQLIYSKSHRVNPTYGGFLRSRFGGDRLGSPVTAGTVLGEVVSPYTFETMEELVAPADGLLFYVARDYPVRPGDWAFGIADTIAGDVRWIDNEDGGGS